ncbi:hypothetical protein WAI453_002980 [Rhynchosporium graminicola]
MLKFFPTIVSAVLAVQAVFAVNITQTIPVAKTLNGSYHGVHIEPLNQDLFLGIPFAEPPVKDLRFANPRSLNITWQGSLPATNYAPRCVGYGSVQQGYQQNEDCLYLNLVRPAGYENESLPLLVWIHGGGFSEGGGSDMRFNLSFIVNNSVSIGKPIMAASVAFRLGPFGFMSGDKVAEEGSSNAGLKDQRLGLHWLKENIAGFGGDPEKITLWGQSSGAASVGRQLFAFNGRNDNLFRAAIMMCGTAIFSGPDRSTEYYQPRFDSLVKATGCEEHANTLACIRQLPYAVLNNILNTTSFISEWFPIVDGDFTARHGSEQMADGSFVHVPIITGTNSDEGTSFAQPSNSSEAIISQINGKQYKPHRSGVLKAHTTHSHFSWSDCLASGYSLAPCAPLYGGQRI